MGFFDVDNIVKSITDGNGNIIAHFHMFSDYDKPQLYMITVPEEYRKRYGLQDYYLIQSNKHYFYVLQTVKRQMMQIYNMPQCVACYITIENLTETV